MKNYIICDLDGTLCDISHRVHHVLEKDWDAFYAGIPQDKCNEDILRLLYALSLNDDVRVIAVTGRPAKYWQMTVNWLNEKNTSRLIDVVLMRSDGDFRNDHEVKLELIDKYFKGRERALEAIWFFLEDRAQATEEFRNAGFRVLQVAQGDY